MSPAKRVLVICRSFPAHRAGGMERHAQDVVEGLAARGWIVDVLTTPLPPRPVLEPLRPNGELLVAGRVPGTQDLAFWRDAARVAEAHCRRFSVPVVHAQGFAGLAMRGAFLRERLVTTVHGTLWSETPLDRRAGLRGVARAAALWRFKHRLAFAPLWRWWLRSGPRVVVDSAFTARELRREGLAREPAVVPLGFTMEGRWIEPRPALAPQGEIVLLAAGRLERTKGFHVLLDALPDDPRARLVIAGDGAERASLEALAARHGERVRFLGRVDEAELRRWMARADVFLNADQGQPAFGLANAEALAAGCPVVASAVGAHPEVVEPRAGDGLLVRPAGDVEAWRRAIAKALARLPEPPDARRRRSRRAQERFSRDRMIDGIEAAYRAIC